MIAVDDKALRGSARLEEPRRHLLSAVTHGCPVTLAQAEVGSKTNETRHFQPLLAPLEPCGRRRPMRWRTVARMTRLGRPPVI